MTDKVSARSELATRRGIERNFDRAAQRSERVMEQFENAFDAFWETMVGRGYPPFVQNMARANIELMGFLGRRTRAYMELPAHLVRCDSPEGVLEEHARFVKEAMEDYESASGRVVQALSNGAKQALRNSTSAAHKAVLMQTSNNGASVRKQSPKRAARRRSRKSAQRRSRG